MGVTLIFLFLKYIAAALVVAYFTTVFMKRNEVKVDVKATVLQKQLQAYTRLHDLMMETEHHIAPSQIEEAYYSEFLDRFSFKIDPTLNSYPTCFDSLERLEQYHDKIKHEKRKDEPFLDYETNNVLEEMLMWMEEIIGINRRFANVESDNSWNLSEDIINRNTSLAIHLIGLALQNDTDNFVSKLTNVFQKKLHNPKLSSWRGLSLRNKMNKLLSEYCEKSMDEKGGLHKFAEKLYYHKLHPLYGHSQLHIIISNGNVAMMLALVHFSPNYSPDQYFDLPKEQSLAFLKDFHTILSKYFK